MCFHERRPLPRFGQVRRPIWMLLAGALVTTVALPLLTLWQAATSPLQAEICLWPPTPQVHATTQVVVTLPNATDRAAVAGPWAHLQVAWDMATMPMGTQPLLLAGDRSHAGAFTIPLHLDMAGPWWIDLLLQTSGRPEWHRHFPVTVAPSRVTASTLPTQSAHAIPAPCPADGRTGRARSGSIPGDWGERPGVSQYFAPAQVR